MLATSKNVAGARAIISVRSSTPVVSRWLWPGNRSFLEVASMVVTWWIAAFLRSACHMASRNPCSRLVGRDGQLFAHKARHHEGVCLDKDFANVIHHQILKKFLILRDLVEKLTYKGSQLRNSHSITLLQLLKFVFRTQQEPKVIDDHGWYGYRTVTKLSFGHQHVDQFYMTNNLRKF